MTEQRVVSPVINNLSEEEDISGEDICDRFFHILDQLNLSLEQYKLPQKVDVVYNPTIYARHTFEMYVRKYCNTRKPVLYLDMSPGPLGMAQTGVPFGEIKSVRDWLGISGPVGKPPRLIKSRPVMGFECRKTEVNGKLFWGLFKTLCGTPENFFKTSFVYNYLPQLWMMNSGYNLTPGHFKKSELQDLFSICDAALSKILELYKVEKIVAIGKFCQSRAKAIIKQHSFSRPIEILNLPHPSPWAANNANWSENAPELLKNYNLLEYYQQDSVTTI